MTHQNLQALVDSLGTAGNAHDRAIIMIHEAIRQGINTGPAIIAALHAVGFNKQHVGFWLHQEAGTDPARHHWWRDADGRYHNHDVN